MGKKNVERNGENVGYRPFSFFFNFAKRCKKSALQGTAFMVPPKGSLLNSRVSLVYLLSDLSPACCIIHALCTTSPYIIPI